MSGLRRIATEVDHAVALTLDPSSGIPWHASEAGEGREAAPLGRFVEEGLSGVSRAGEGRDGQRPRARAVRRQAPEGETWKGQGPGVFEMAEDHGGDTYRAIYTVRFREVVYVLHAFQKKSPKGVRTARSDIELVERRLRVAQRDYETRYGKSKR